MTTNELYTYILLFFIYSFLGYITEVLYCSVGRGHFVNRGFLHGPFLPIYGLGGVAAKLVLGNITKAGMINMIIIFASGMVIASLIEYVSSWAMERLFSIKLWDYSKHRFNLNGRICLKNSILFGFMTLVVIYLVQPMLDKFLSLVDNRIKGIFVIILSAYFIVDLMFSVKSITAFRRAFEGIKAKLEEARWRLDPDSSAKHHKLSFSELKGRINSYIDKEMTSELENKIKLYELRENLDRARAEIKEKHSRIFKSNPSATFEKEESRELFDELKKYITHR